jgi:hypothetical protein
MKLTKSKLKQIIKEELENILAQEGDSNPCERQEIQTGKPHKLENGKCVPVLDAPPQIQIPLTGTNAPED